MLAAASVGGAMFFALGLLGADQVVQTGPDLAGIALVITAVSGLIATVGALVVGLRRKPIDPMQAALAEALLEQTARLRGEDPK